MDKSDGVVIPFPTPASTASANRPTPGASPACPTPEDASRALLNDLILHFCRTQAARRKGHD